MMRGPASHRSRTWVRTSTPGQARNPALRISIATETLASPASVPCQPTRTPAPGRNDGLWPRRCRCGRPTVIAVVARGRSRQRQWRPQRYPAGPSGTANAAYLGSRGFDKAMWPGAALVRGTVTGERRLGLPRACRHGPSRRALPPSADPGRFRKSITGCEITV